MQKQKTVILGLGIGGIVASTILKKSMIKMNVTAVDKVKLHHFTSSYPLLLVGKRKPENITKNFNHLKKLGINILQSEIKKIDLLEKQIITNEKILNYDYLIISLGVDYHPETVPGFKNYAYNIYEFEDVVKLQKKLQEFKKGNIILFISSTPYRCPPAPYETIFLLEEYFRKKGLSSKVNLTIVTPETTPEPLAGPRVGQSLRNMLAERGIELITEANILKIEKNTLVLDHGNKIIGDLFLGVASHWTPQVLRDTNLVDADGWVKVNQNTLETSYKGVYAIGDAAAIKLPVIGANAPKAGIFAHYQAEVAARNIALLAQGKDPKFKYTGKGA